jgi:hypothetical protein
MHSFASTQTCTKQAAFQCCAASTGSVPGCCIAAAAICCAGSTTPSWTIMLSTVSVMISPCCHRVTCWAAAPQYLHGQGNATSGNPGSDQYVTHCLLPRASHPSRVQAEHNLGSLVRCVDSGERLPPLIQGEGLGPVSKAVRSTTSEALLLQVQA